MLTIMTGSLLTLVCDDEASQILLEDLPAGPGGEACLTPVDGVELLFDNADGRLVRVLVDATASDGRMVAGELVLFFIAGLLGYQAAAAVEEAHRWDGAPIPLRVDKDKLASLSRLARLDAARATSPVAGSPGWAVEAARLAAEAGLTARAAAEARRATAALAGPAPDASPDAVPAALIGAVADTVQEIDPELAGRLREHAVLPRSGRDATARSRSGRDATARSDRAWPPGLPYVFDHDDHVDGLERWLDPQTVPAGVFRWHLWPGADLTARATESGVLVEAELVPGADRAGLEGCRARLVDPARRAVIGMAPFAADGLRAWAEIPHPPVPPGGAWVEVAGEPDRPVLSAQLRHIRRAMRWADAALLAGRQASGPAGPAGPRWERLARETWERCAEDWSAARDANRAYLAAERARVLGSGVSAAEPPSAWAKDLARRLPPREAPFLAETVAELHRDVG